MPAAQKIHSTTQKFTEIVDFVGSVVVMNGGNACMVIELTASNFSLLSKREQDVKIFSYASLLNSLSFPMQILIRNKRMDITSYLRDLDQIILNTKNEQLANYIEYYRAFIQEMVSVNTVLNKSFYIIIPYSSLEQGATGVMQTQQNTRLQIETFAQTAHKMLEEKAIILLAQIQKFSVTAKILEKEDLIKLFYDIYNEGDKIETEELDTNVNQVIVTSGGKP
jgi:hypothetical protein